LQPAIAQGSWAATLHSPRNDQRLGATVARYDQFHWDDHDRGSAAVDRGLKLDADLVPAGEPPGDEKSEPVALGEVEGGDFG